MIKLIADVINLVNSTDLTKSAETAKQVKVRLKDKYAEVLLDYSDYSNNSDHTNHVKQQLVQIETVVMDSNRVYL